MTTTIPKAAMGEKAGAKTRMPKIAMIGAGGVVFPLRLMGDFLSFPELRGATYALMDLDFGRAERTATAARDLAAHYGFPATIEATTDRRRALDGADYAINMIQVGGYDPATKTDFAIPKKYGLRQTIGDTLGIGGIMRALRTIPVMLEMGRQMEEVCPDVLFLNYSNPMAMLCMAMERATAIRTVGLCHSVQGTAADLAEWLGVPFAEVDYLCAGINHVAFYLRLEHRGEDLYPRLRGMAAGGRIPDWNRVRYEVFHRFGYFPTESSEHFAEYCPWFIKDGRPDLIEDFNIPLDEYLVRCERQIAEWQGLRGALELGGAMTVAPSNEYGGRIVEAIETGEPFTFNGNVPNSDADGMPLLDGLSPEAIVEVPCVAGPQGIERQRVGALPPQLAVLIRTNLNVHELTVRPRSGARASTSTTRRCSTRTRQPSYRWQRSGHSSTSCSTRTATSCRPSPRTSGLDQRSAAPA